MTGAPEVGEAVRPARVVRVVPDVAGVHRAFDYVIPDALAERVGIGSLVRIDLQGRRVGGWVVADRVDPPAGVTLKPLAGVTGRGPDDDLVRLADWAAWRWAGRRRAFLRTASPEGAVQGLPPPAPPSVAVPTTVDPLVDAALAGRRTVLRLPPAADVLPLLVSAARLGTTLVVAPDHAVAASLGGRLRRAGVPVAVLPRGWAQAAAGGGVVIGARAAAWAPAPDLAAVVVLDEHEEAHQEEGSPTWCARDVAAERARRADVPCVWTSPCPSLEALAWGELLAPSRTEERAGWPVVDVVDRRREDPLRADLYSSRLVDLIRSSAPEAGRPVLCVLNRKGRARLLVCAACTEPARCETCGATVALDDDGALRCARCRSTRPAACRACGATRLKQRRLGTARAREDLERLAGRPVAEITGDLPPGAPLPDAPVIVGTEAVLRRVERAAAIAFLDLDGELLAPRYRAAEETMALVARAARLLGGKAGGGRLLLQTRLPRHEVVQGALLADPGRVSAAERERRDALALPPATAMAHVAGAGAPAFAEAVGAHPGIDVLGPVDGAHLLRAPDHRTLCDALAATPRPPGRLRVAVDPRRI